MLFESRPDDTAPLAHRGPRAVADLSHFGQYDVSATGRLCRRHRRDERARLISTVMRGFDTPQSGHGARTVVIGRHALKRLGLAAIVVVTATLGFASSGCLLLLAGAIEASKTSTPAPPSPPDDPPQREEAVRAPAPPPQQNTVPFDRSAAAASITDVSGTIQDCKVDGGPAGAGHVTLQFGPSGKVQSAIADQPPYADTPTGACIAGKFSQAHVPRFSGEPVKVGKSFSID
jgi:hypothetical protein